MHSAQRFFRTVLVLVSLVSATAVYADEADDYTPDVTDRVARISFLKGDVQVRRSGSTDWEKAALNLPLVEGDEVATDAWSRVEIQLNVNTHIRLAENSYVTFTALRDEGVALSLPRGSLSLRAVEFNKERGYIEFDLPKTTVSIQKAGMYRLDAGQDSSGEIGVSASNGGEARVYTESSGFTVKDRRRATIFIDGQYAGEWQSGEVSRFADDFDTWALERDAVIAKRLRDAYYDRYYDRDIYGADELSDNGEWVHTRKYGYVWRPSRNATSSYSNWSPYRYGHWRWVPAYGWVWVNDEPWGWATYHYGRWVWDDGYWAWSPYSYYRSGRSWWYPALVVLSVFDSNVCWYPLPYNYGYYNYNYDYYSHYSRHHRGNNWGNHGGNGNWNNHQGNNHQPPPGGVPQPTPTPGSGPWPAYMNRGRPPIPALLIPPTAVVSMPSSDFGRDTRIGDVLPRDYAKRVLEQDPTDQRVPPALPTLGDLNGKVGQNIRSSKMPPVADLLKLPIGAGDRRDGGPLDPELKRSRMQGDREPVRQPVTNAETPATDEGRSSRKTGAVGRPRVEPVPTERDPAFMPPVQDVPAEKKSGRENREIEPIRQPSYEPPREKPRREPAPEPVRQPSYEPPKSSRDDSPRPSRSEPPPSRPEPSHRSDPPPQKSDPPSKPAPPSDGDRGAKKRDGS